MALVTKQNVIDRALRLADYENSEFFNIPELENFFKAGYQEFYDLIVDTLEDYFIADPVETTTTNNEVDLATVIPDFYRLAGIDRKISSTEFVTLEEFNFRERNFLNSQTDINNYRYDKEYKYRLLGNKIKLINTGSTVPQSLDLKIWFIPNATIPANLGDTVDGFNGWDEYVMLFMVKRMKIRTEEDYSGVQADLDVFGGRIQKLARKRNRNKTRTITNVRKVRTRNGYI